MHFLDGMQREPLLLPSEHTLASSRLSHLLRLTYKGTPRHSWSHKGSLGLPHPPHILLPLLSSSGLTPDCSFRGFRLRSPLGHLVTKLGHAVLLRYQTQVPQTPVMCVLRACTPTLGTPWDHIPQLLPSRTRNSVGSGPVAGAHRRCMLARSCAYEASMGLREQNKADNLSPSCRSKKETHISINSVMRQHQLGHRAVRIEKLNRKDLFFCCMRPCEAVNGHGY